MRVTLPADAESAIAEVGGIAALLDKNGWKAAALVAVSCRAGEGQGTSRTSTRGRVSLKAFAKALNLKGWGETVILRNYNAWEDAAEDGLVPHAADLVYGEKVELPTEGWQKYYPPTNPVNADIAVQAAKDGVGAQTANVIAQNTKAMATAIKASPKVAAAAAQALIETGDVSRLSSATAAAARNRQVERNRTRATSGQPKGRSVADPKPSSMSPDVSAFLSVQGLATALRALVTTFPREWEGLSDEAKSEDFVGVCEETLDKIDIAVSNCRNLISGGVTDDAIERLLDEVS